MSQQTPETILDNRSITEPNADSNVSRQEIIEVANLARLGIDENTAGSYADDISKVLKLMQTLGSVDTTEVRPLSNIHEVCQDLRSDVAKHDINRQRNQSVAPAVEDGLYLVPQVIE
ncbi:Asp-tRNA(Asn)/Glu-tRNA(Gln) amidotransferase subunit GatC [uncultured Psychrobacter sp.]|uniref:Asp-tRNA(Asn)/Glu-tRNA(Gln) amidotransferase subunit GatC n=1 Tax=uncultured Psychrobacter sp. TaxID=259303 RepID=UPI0034598AC3